MQYQITSIVNSLHPTEALADLEDILHFVDEISNRFSADGFIKEDDLPLSIYYHGPEHEYYDDLGYLILPSSLIISCKGHEENPIANDPLFELGRLVRSQVDGHKYSIRGRAYFNASKSYTYLLYSESTKELIHLEQHELIYETLFLQLIDLLLEATEEYWSWNDDIGMFLQLYNKARKMRISDALSTIIMHQNKEAVPF